MCGQFVYTGVYPKIIMYLINIVLKSENNLGMYVCVVAIYLKSILHTWSEGGKYANVSLSIFRYGKQYWGPERIPQALHRS